MKQARANGRNAQELERELAAERAETRKADLAWAMRSPRGRRLVFEFLYSPTLGLAFDEVAPADPRVVAKGWVDRLKAEQPEMYLEMLREQLEARDEKKRLRDVSAEETPEDEGDST